MTNTTGNAGLSGQPSKPPTPPPPPAFSGGGGGRDVVTRLVGAGIVTSQVPSAAVTRTIQQGAGTVTYQVHPGAVHPGEVTPTPTAPNEMPSSLSGRILSQSELSQMAHVPIGGVVDVPRAVSSGAVAGYRVGEGATAQYFLTRAEADKNIASQQVEYIKSQGQNAVLTSQYDTNRGYWIKSPVGDIVKSSGERGYYSSDPPIAQQIYYPSPQPRPSTPAFEASSWRERIGLSAKPPEMPPERAKASFWAGYEIGKSGVITQPVETGIDVRTLSMYPIKTKVDIATEKYTKGVEEWKGFVPAPEILKTTVGKEFLGIGKTMLTTVGQFPQFASDIATGVELFAREPVKTAKIVPAGLGIMAGSAAAHPKETAMQLVSMAILSAGFEAGIGAGVKGVKSIPTEKMFGTGTPKAEPIQTIATPDEIMGAKAIASFKDVSPLEWEQAISEAKGGIPQAKPAYIKGLELFRDTSSVDWEKAAIATGATIAISSARPSKAMPSSISDELDQMRINAYNQLVGEPRPQDVTGIEQPHSPLKIDTTVRKGKAVEMAEGMAEDLRNMGMDVTARGADIVKTGTADKVAEIDYFNRVKEEQPTQFDKMFGSEFLSGSQSLAPTGYGGRTAPAADISILAKMFGINPADVGLFDYDFIKRTTPIERYNRMAAERGIPGLIDVRQYGAEYKLPTVDMYNEMVGELPEYTLYRKMFGKAKTRPSIEVVKPLRNIEQYNKMVAESTYFRGTTINVMDYLLVGGGRIGGSYHVSSFRGGGGRGLRGISSSEIMLKRARAGTREVYPEIIPFLYPGIRSEGIEYQQKTREASPETMLKDIQTSMVGNISAGFETTKQAQTEKQGIELVNAFAQIQESMAAQRQRQTQDQITGMTDIQITKQTQEQMFFGGGGGGGGGGLELIPKLKIPLFQPDDRKRRKYTPKTKKAGYFFTERTSPIMPALYGIDNMFGTPKKHKGKK